MDEAWDFICRHNMSAILVLFTLCGLSFFFVLLIGDPRRRITWNARAASPDREIGKTPKTNGRTSQKQSYNGVFPPTQRGLMAKLGHDQFANTVDIDLSTTPKNILKLEDDYRSADSSDFVFSGFSVGDIRALGDFPDYATLSGVPLPTPLENFDIDKAVPRPYRPIRWPYHQTMSLTKMDADFWIELESTYRKRIAQRKKIHAEYGTGVLEALPGSELAVKELLEMVVQFLCARYPNQFLLEGKTFTNRILGTETDLAQEDPLKFLLDNVPEEFCLMLRDDKTGRYVLRAGVLCSAVGWKLSEKMGKGLSGIHGPVPDYKEKMEFSMDRFFTKMPTNKPIQRASWGLEMGQPLFLPLEHPDFGEREAQDPDLGPDNVFLRIDWQTLRRLPLSGAVLFNFKALFTPMTEFEDEPCIPRLFRTILDEGKQEMMKYKGTWHVEHVAKPTLRKYEQSQIENGLMDEDWEAQTLPEAPFFKGWEKKWVVE